VAGLALVMFGAAHRVSWVWHVPAWNIGPLQLPTIDMSMPSQPPADQSLTPYQAAAWVVWLFRALGLAVAAVILFFVGRWLYRMISALVNTSIERRRPLDRLPSGAGVPGAPLTPEQVSDALTEALRRLDAAAAPGDAVIVAWLTLEDAAGRHGVGRRPSQTPTEFAVDLLERSNVPAAELTTLRQRYVRARFSHLPTTREDVAAARSALTRIASSLDYQRASA
jgi:hypothetical protein